MGVVIGLKLEIEGMDFIEIVLIVVLVVEVDLVNSCFFLFCFW